MIPEYDMILDVLYCYSQNEYFTMQPAWTQRVKVAAPDSDEPSF